MKKFNFKFSRTILVFIYIGIALAVIAFGVNTYFVFSQGVGEEDKIYPIVRYLLMYFVSILLFVVLVSLKIASYYSVDEKYLKTSFGIIKSKYEIAKIEAVLIDRTNNKLSVYFEDKSFIVIAVNDEWYEEFTDALLKVRPEIEFSIKSKESGADDDKKST